ncbi:hypothetical protein PVAND_008143 [Polypedilum vanderplanki]|uniref:Uncharacterized protein n=1 Tax=Polypedilum vanderplanki TaxID=319348 RepID=A0A9J6C8S8_POLVA|nr:hypothetical protein PVAND_008143 [Polypedilum vanderplanki]
MKRYLVNFVLCFATCFALEAAIKESQPKKRSIGEEEFLGLSPLTDTSISSHTHTHTTAIVEKPIAIPFPIATPTITTTKIISPAIHSTILPSSYTTYRSSYPYYSGFSKYPYYSGLSFGKFYNGWTGKYNYPSYYPSSIYSKSYYASSPSVWKYKW